MQSGGGLGYRTDAELLMALRRIVHDDDLRDELAHRGYAMRTGEWSEARHLDRYFGPDRAVPDAPGARRPTGPLARAGRRWPFGPAMDRPRRDEGADRPCRPGFLDIGEAWLPASPSCSWPWPASRGSSPSRRA